MNRRTFLLALTIALAAAVAWIVLRTWRAPESDATRGAPASSEVLERATPSSLAAPAAQADVGQREARSSSSDAASQPVPPGETIPLQVIDEATGAPVPGADVRWVGLDDHERWANVYPVDDLSEVEGLCVERGHALRTDGEGRVDIPRVEKHGLVTASKNGSWGRAEYQRYAKQLKLAIGVDGTLSAQVVDARGEPIAGAQVLFCSSNQGVRARARTEPGTGIARLVHARSVARKSEGESYFVSVDALLAKALRVAVDFQSASRDAIVLKLPPTGSVDVRVHDASGALIGARAYVTLTRTADASSRENGVISLPTSGGIASFPLVEVGLAVRAHVDAGQVDRDKTALGDLIANSDGPAAFGDRAIIDVGGAGTSRTILGRAVDQASQPIASVELVLDVQQFVDGRRGKSTSTYAKTNERGEFRLELGQDWTASMRAAVDLMLLRAIDRSSLHGSFELSGDYRLGETSIGDVVMREPRLLASGRVIDERGEAIEGATIHVFEKRRDGDSGSDAWSQLPWAVQSDAKGEFDARADVQSDALALCADAEKCLRGAMVEIRAGQTGVTLTLKRAGGFEGSVRVDPDVSVREISVHWISTDADTGEQKNGSLACEAAKEPGLGRFSISTLAPGRTRIDFRAGANLPLESLDELDIRGGEIAKLGEIDLRGRVHVFAIDVLEPGDRPLQSALIHVRPAGSSGNWGTAVVQAGRARVIDVAPAIDVSIDVGGYRPENLTSVTGDARVVLRPGMPVTLKLEGDASLPAGAGTLSCMLTPLALDRSTQLAASPVAATFANGEAHLEVGTPGAYRVTFTLVVSRNGATQRTPLVTTSDRRVEIADASGEQTLSVELSQTELAPALEGQ
jgi:hypothetical protein